MSRTVGTVTELKKLWWFKINTKCVRKHALDGAFFPHRVKVRYTADVRNMRNGLACGTLESGTETFPKRGKAFRWSTAATNPQNSELSADFMHELL